MASKSCLAVILAAGEGTRMRSAKPKVLHMVAGLPLLGHVMAAARAAGTDRLAVVHAPGAGGVQTLAARLGGANCSLHEQAERLGTAHAVLAARSALEQQSDHVLVLPGDAPLIRPQNLQNARNALDSGLDLVVLGFRAANPYGYGRLLLDGNGALLAIVEERDATAQQRQVDLCNSSILAFRGSLLPDLLDAIGNDNDQKEYYLTDAVQIARERGLKVGMVECPEEDVMGINDRAQLAMAEGICQGRLRNAAMAAGVTMVAPETVFMCYDTVLSRDVFLEPHVYFGPGVSVGEGAIIHAFCHMEGAKIAANAELGPFARLRPGASVGEKAKLGNFVEVKNAQIGAGAKANHLSYIGDGTVGAAANIGAGTIFCNYDGINKHETHVGERVFIGSNSSLVAPVTIGAGAMIGSGSVISDDVSPDALALGRARQTEKPGWAAEFRARTVKKKK